jgi:hypothetical protein
MNYKPKPMYKPKDLYTSINDSYLKNEMQKMYKHKEIPIQKDNPIAKYFKWY